MRLFALLVVSALLISGCSDSSKDEADDSDQDPQTDPTPPSGPRTHGVILQANKFVNQTINITAGDSVQWTHKDGNVPHNIASDDPEFNSHPNCSTTLAVPNDPPCMVETSDPYPQVFLEAGTVNYRCDLHASMTGVIHVKPGNNTMSPGTIDKPPR